MCILQEVVSELVDCTGVSVPFMEIILLELVAALVPLKCVSAGAGARCLALAGLCPLSPAQRKNSEVARDGDGLGENTVST